MSIKGGPSDWWERLGILSRRIGFEPLKITFDRPPPRRSAPISSPFSPVSPGGGLVQPNFDVSVESACDEGALGNRSPQERLAGSGGRDWVSTGGDEGGAGGKGGEEDLGDRTAKAAKTTRTGPRSGTTPQLLPDPRVRLLSFSSPVYTPGSVNEICSQDRGEAGIPFPSPGMKEARRIGRIGGDDEEKARVYFGRNCLCAAFGRWGDAVEEYKDETLRMRDFLR